MKLFRRQNANASGGESDHSEAVVRRNWRARTLQLFVSALVIAAIVLAAVWAFRTPQKTTPSHQKTPAKTAQGNKPSKSKSKAGQSGQTGQATGGSSQPSQSTSQPAAGGGSTGQTGQANTSAGTSPATGSSSLTNTGPGDLVGWFAATSLGATGFYYAVILRRLKTRDQ